ncbi:tRNA uridine 5-carboxymethylaminomethyl modification protein [Gracilaria domingensis]|nr:tRNA uridine 5-carboxymethylaminomethyl modification protein [Gracilaria domingensis]
MIALTVSQSQAELPHAGGSHDQQLCFAGARHCGCAAALAASKISTRTLLLTMHFDKIPCHSCNPAVDSPGKSHLVHETEALAGWIIDICTTYRRNEPGFEDL